MIKVNCNLGVIIQTPNNSHFYGLIVDNQSKAVNCIKKIIVDLMKLSSVQIIDEHELSDSIETQLGIEETYDSFEEMMSPQRVIIDLSKETFTHWNIAEDEPFVSTFDLLFDESIINETSTINTESDNEETEDTSEKRLTPEEPHHLEKGDIVAAYTLINMWGCGWIIGKYIGNNCVQTSYKNTFSDCKRIIPIKEFTKNPQEQISDFWVDHHK